MKRKFLISAIVFLPLFADTMETPHESKKRFVEAKKLYENNKFYESYTLLEKLIFHEIDNVEVNFLYAKTLFATKKYDEAMSVYERLLMINPSLDMARYELALVYMKLEMLSSADEQFNIILSHPKVPQEIREKIKLYKDAIKKALSKSYLEGDFQISWGRDTNVNYGTSQRDFFVPLFSLYFSGSKNKVDSFHASSLSLKHYTKLDASDQRWGVVNEAYMYEQTYATTPSYNLRYGSVGSSLCYQNGKVSLCSGLVADNLNFGLDSYYRSFGLTEKISYKYNENIYIENQTAIKTKLHHADQFKYRNSRILSNTSSVKYISSSGDMFLSIGGGHFKEDQLNETSASEVDNMKKNINFQYVQQLSPLYSFAIGYDRSFMTYAKNNPFFLSKEATFSKVTTLSLVKKISNFSSVSFNVIRTDTQSNHNYKEYLKDQFILSYAYKF